MVIVLLTKIPTYSSTTLTQCICMLHRSTLAPGDVPTAGSAPIGVADKAKMDSEVSE